MPNLDIEVSADLKELFKLPDCIDVELPKPSPMSVTLPTGGTLKAFTDISKGIPTDCSMSFSLLLQIAPLLASMECIVKILKLIKPLIDIINGLPIPPVKAIQEFAKAAVDLAPCLAIPTPAAIIPFIRDILCLVLSILKCFLGQLKSIVGVMAGLKIQLDLANAAGNVELATALGCAQRNAEISASHLTQSIEPLGVILDLIGPLMGIAGLNPIRLPGIGGASDVQALNQVIETLQGVVATIQGIVDTIGGCGS
jgi:hypothetical protein